MKHDYYEWLVFSNQGIITFSGKASLETVNHSMKALTNATEWEAWYVNDATARVLINNYLTDCFNLTIGVVE